MHKKWYEDTLKGYGLGNKDESNLHATSLHVICVMLLLLLSDKEREDFRER